MISDPGFYLCAVPAVILVGLSKGGFGSGLGVLGVPLLALAIPPVQAAAIMLPILLVMDAVGLYAWRAVYDAKTLAILLPAAIVGIAAGWFLAARVSEPQVRLIVGTVALLFALDYWLRGRRRLDPRPHNRAKGWFWGAVSGFTSFISHAGGPPYQMYALPLRLDPRLFAGTAAIFFASVNAVKVVPYLALGQFSPANLATSLVLMPLAPLATLAGVRLVRRISPDIFYRFTYATIFLVALKLIWDGLQGSLGG